MPQPWASADQKSATQKYHPDCSTRRFLFRKFPILKFQREFTRERGHCRRATRGGSRGRQGGGGLELLESCRKKNETHCGEEVRMRKISAPARTHQPCRISHAGPRSPMGSPLCGVTSIAILLLRNIDCTKDNYVRERLVGTRCVERPARRQSDCKFASLRVRRAASRLLLL